MNTEVIRRYGEGIFDNSILNALCDPYYQQGRGYRYAVNRMITDDQVIEFLVRYWNDNAEQYGEYRRIDRDRMISDLPLRFLNVLSKLGIRRSGKYYTNAPINRAGARVNVSVDDLRTVQGLKHIWITWHHAYLLCLRRAGKITLDQMLNLWTASTRDIEKAIEPFFNAVLAHRMRCALTRWVATGYIERVRRGVYKIK